MIPLNSRMKKFEKARQVFLVLNGTVGGWFALVWGAEGDAPHGNGRYDLTDLPQGRPGAPSWLPTRLWGGVRGHPGEGFHTEKKRKNNIITDKKPVKHSRASRQPPEGPRRTAPRQLLTSCAPLHHFPPFWKLRCSLRGLQFPRRAARGRCARGGGR